jgi:hypothetical protein
MLKLLLLNTLQVHVDLLLRYCSRRDTNLTTAAAAVDEKEQQQQEQQQQ